MRKIQAGRGYDYLLKSVVRGDANMADPNPVTRYYTEEGTPPGRWMGSALHAFGDGEIRRGDQVTPQQLQLLIGAGLDPVTGEKLGRAFPVYPPVEERLAARVAELSPSLTAEQRSEATRQIRAEESVKPSSGVAGYDFTFSVPKSVSALWGVADAGTQALIVGAHHEAVAEVLDFMEREVAATRRGVAAGNGAVMQADVIGVAATAYDHWDSRLGDPQLHTHVVVSNKVKTTEDGRWRSLDGTAMYEANVPISEHYNAVLADRLTRLFGIEWEQRERGAERNAAWELAPVPETLIREFSSRSSHIDQEKDRLIAEYTELTGRRPSSAKIIQLRAKATLATRPEKEIHSLFDLTTQWRGRAQKILGRGAVDWAKEVTAPPRARPTLRADDVPLDAITEVGISVVGAVEEKRSTWKHWNLWAEASRQTMGWRFASVEHREAVVGMIVEAAKQESLAITPPDLVTVPEVFQRTDGTSRFRPRHGVVFTSETLLAAEDRLLARAEDMTAPAIGLDVIERVTRKEHLLSAEQSETLARIAVSGRRLDLLVGPAGAGKTTAMHALKTAWVKAHGKESIVGLAPSAVAAQVLAEDLGIACENTAKWLHEHDRGRAEFRSGQLVIIDEATLAGTLTLDRLTALAAEAGAKVLLVGDWAQLQSVDAGGAFSLLASARPDTPELTEVHRFTHEWEKTASLDLRFGRAEVIGTYVEMDRVQQGTTDEMMDAAYLAWAADVKDGRTSLLVAEATDMVIRLNRRARADRIVANPVGDIEVNLEDGTQASEGDIIITRHNDRRLHTMRGGWVRNGDRWTVTRVHRDGSMQVQRLGPAVGGSVVLPAAYVAEHVDLGYAVTAHRAQGMTVDTSHVVVTGSTTRENLYVSMTRGRDSNIAYVALDKPDEGHTPPEPDDVNAYTVLYGVLQHIGGELSAHQMITAEQDRWSSIAQIAAEYETIGAVAQRDRWVAMIRGSGLTEVQIAKVLASESFGPLTAELRRAEADRHDIDRLLPALVSRRALGDAEDIGAVLISRLERVARPRRGGRRPSPRLVAGLIPVAAGRMSETMSNALAERADLMEARALSLAAKAVEEEAPWLKRLGVVPSADAARRRWLYEARTVAAYRDRYNVDGRRALGEPRTESQKFDAVRAQRAIRRAQAISDADTTHNVRSQATDRKDGRTRSDSQRQSWTR
ncbi:MobF family relaxase [Nocardioides sp.]|uniref:MobF family relaxase n=1 Tax=Nocardioides sp. TaxID=35761 RepID=UPI0039E56884